MKKENEFNEILKVCEDKKALRRSFDGCLTITEMTNELLSSSSEFLTFWLSTKIVSRSSKRLKKLYKNFLDFMSLERFKLRTAPNGSKTKSG